MWRIVPHPLPCHWLQLLLPRLGLAPRADPEERPAQLGTATLSIIKSATVPSDRGNEFKATSDYGKVFKLELYDNSELRIGALTHDELSSFVEKGHVTCTCRYIIIVNTQPRIKLQAGIEWAALPVAATIESRGWEPDKVQTTSGKCESVSCGWLSRALPFLSCS